jgi:hypothetical protein
LLFKCKDGFSVAELDVVDIKTFACDVLSSLILLLLLKVVMVVAAAAAAALVVVEIELAFVAVVAAEIVAFALDTAVVLKLLAKFNRAEPFIWLLLLLELFIALATFDTLDESTTEFLIKLVVDAVISSLLLDLLLFIVVVDAELLVLFAFMPVRFCPVGFSLANKADGA